MEADYRRLKAIWVSGSRDREDALRLLFVAWMHWADPPFLTGLEDDPEAPALWREIFESFGGENSADTEFVFVASLMAYLFPYCLGDEEEWRLRADRMRMRLKQLAPNGLPPGTFEGRGEYGRYFAHQSSW